MLPDGTKSTELVAAGFGGLTSEVLHGQRAVEENAEAFDSQRLGTWCWKGVGGNEGQLIAQHRTRD